MTSPASSPFDALAADYDRQESENTIRRRMRERSLAVLEATFPSGSSLLDIGCGTGTEALWLANRGRHVTAIDPSAQMLDILNVRARAVKLDIPTHLLRAGDLGNLTGEFDGAYSSFGALNAEPDISAALAALARRLRPGGKIVLGVMNRWCVTEIALMLGAGRPRQAFRRYRPTLAVHVGDTPVDVHYPSWPELKLAVGRPQSRLRGARSNRSGSRAAPPLGVAGGPLARHCRTPVRLNRPVTLAAWGSTRRVTGFPSTTGRWRA